MMQYSASQARWACAFTPAVVSHPMGRRPLCFQVNPGSIQRGVPELENCRSETDVRFLVLSHKTLRFFSVFFGPRDVCRGTCLSVWACSHFTLPFSQELAKIFTNKCDGCDCFCNPSVSSYTKVPPL